MQRHQGAKVEHFDVSNVIYHKFSHGAVSYTLNGENVNVMLECLIKNSSVSSPLKEKPYEKWDGNENHRIAFPERGSI